jgi:peptidoglycan/LPS O-acetylase OafA/YrhL
MRYTAVHRTFGRIYVCLVVIAAPLGLVIQYFDERTGDPRWVTVAAGVDAFLWLLATGMAFWCIRYRRIEQHRQWMFRSFAMALLFLEVRVVLGLTGWEALGPDVGGAVIWACVALAYPLADVVLLIDDRLQKSAAERAAERAAVAPPRA